MRTNKRLDVTHAALSDLSARFEQYEREMPENSFPTFLETLLFDQQGRTTRTRRLRQPANSPAGDTAHRGPGPAAAGPSRH